MTRNQLETYRGAFLQECEEHLHNIEIGFEALRETPNDLETVHGVFRAVHSIKGAAGMVGFHRLVDFTHLVEGLLDEVRSGRLEIDLAIVETLTLALDVLADLVGAIRSDVDLPDGYEAGVARQLGMLCEQERTRSTARKAATAGATSATADSGSGKLNLFRLEFKPNADMLRRLHEPLLLFRQLKELGQLQVTANTSSLPDFTTLNPLEASIFWSLTLETTNPIEAVERVFEFAASHCSLTIEAVAAEKPNAGPQMSISTPDAASLLDPQKSPQSLSSRDGTGPVPGRRPRASSIRVDIEKIERLFDLVGEAAVAQSLIVQQIDPGQIKANSRLDQAILRLGQLTQDLQDGVMSIRAQPVRSLFARMPRVVRDIARQTGKSLHLEVHGEETEIDKMVIEELADPLVHLIRNACDHGIETADERVANGKPPTGVITLRAQQRGGQILIEVSDDGRGLDRNKVREIAVAKRLISGDAELSDQEIDALICVPGFSTADQVSNLSGRGVGMDVVKRNVERLGGHISVRSEDGQGMKVVVALPLTLAVMLSLVVRVSGSLYAMPISAILACRSFASGQVRTLPNLGEVFEFEGEHINVVRLARLFGLSREASSEESLLVIVEGQDGDVLALAVDAVEGCQQVVVKNFRENLDAVQGVAGATILGDGTIALILDPAGIQAAERERQQRSARPRRPLAKVSLAPAYAQITREQVP